MKPLDVHILDFQSLDRSSEESESWIWSLLAPGLLRSSVLEANVRRCGLCFQGALVTPLFSYSTTRQHVLQWWPSPNGCITVVWSMVES